jgi:hypothetical protein
MNRVGGPDELLATLWESYQRITPLATRIHDLLTRRGEVFRNDHIAIRTFEAPGMGLEPMSSLFANTGYVPIDDYQFPAKKLTARAFKTPKGDGPRIFISAIHLDQLPGEAQVAIQSLIDRVPPHPLRTHLENPDLWPMASWATYQDLLKVSEYAAWVAAFGLRANHFTVHANDLTTFSDLEELRDFLMQEGFRLNDQGRIQGNEAMGLAQFSTLAELIPWSFAGETQSIPSCYYEFAFRYPDAKTGALFEGFIPDSANKIFESTDTRHHSTPPVR